MEKLIARNVCLAFKQTVCGFDLLRANGKSYVCDVNGFSFVKNSMKYYDDSAKIMGNMILRALAPQLRIPWSIPFQLGRLSVIDFRTIAAFSGTNLLNKKNYLKFVNFPNR